MEKKGKEENPEEIALKVTSNYSLWFKPVDVSTGSVGNDMED